jgi:hypothetical protein
MKIMLHPIVEQSQECLSNFRRVQDNFNKMTKSTVPTKEDAKTFKAQVTCFKSWARSLEMSSSNNFLYHANSTQQASLKDKLDEIQTTIDLIEESLNFPRVVGNKEVEEVHRQYLRYQMSRIEKQNAELESSTRSAIPCPWREMSSRRMEDSEDDRRRHGS